jgi:hypothetical protein
MRASIQLLLIGADGNYRCDPKSLLVRVTSDVSDLPRRSSCQCGLFQFAVNTIQKCGNSLGTFPRGFCP